MVNVAAEDHEKDDSDKHTLTAWELNDANVVFVLLAGHADTEGLEPTTIDEAKTCLDWPKDDAIQAKFLPPSYLHIPKSGTKTWQGHSAPLQVAEAKSCLTLISRRSRDSSRVDLVLTGVHNWQELTSGRCGIRPFFFLLWAGHGV